MSPKSNHPHHRNPLGWASPGSTSQLPHFLILCIVSTSPHSALLSSFQFSWLNLDRWITTFPPCSSHWSLCFAFHLSDSRFGLWKGVHPPDAHIHDKMKIIKDTGDETNKKLTAHSHKCCDPISWVITEFPGMASFTSSRSLLVFTLWKLFLLHSQGWRN